MSKIWFTSDVHFGHKSILKFCPKARLGEDVSKHVEQLHNDTTHPDYKKRHEIHQEYVRQMDKLLIERWNETVTDDDTIYCLGDFSFYKAAKTESILRQLSGRKILIKGNHDHWIDDSTSKYFETIHDYLKIIIDKKHVVLFHYPIAEWDCMHHGGYHLYGHVHGNLQLEGRAMDVGIDTRPTGDMKPWSWEEIDEILSKKEINKHHGKTKPEAEYDAV